MSSLGSVLEHLKSGKTIAYPTEGVWGLGCDPENQDAIENLLKLISLSLIFISLKLYLTTMILMNFLFILFYVQTWKGLLK